MIRPLSLSLLGVLLAVSSSQAQSPPPGTGVNVSFEASLFQATPTSGHEAGAAVAIEADITLVGVPNGKGAVSGSGLVEVFRGVGGEWARIAPLQADDGAPGAEFGAAVAMTSDTILVGAPSANGAGAVYVYARTAPGAFSWTQEAKLTPDDLAANDDFGSSVALSGDTALIGSPLDDDGGPRTGSAYVFTRTGTVWTQQAKLNAPQPLSEDRFGHAVALEGDRAMIGAPHIDFPNNFTGFVMTFTRVGTTWSEEQVLTPSDGLAGDGFGLAVALDGARAVIGAPFDDDKGLQAGSAFVFELDGSWSEVYKFVDNAGKPGDQAGTAVALQESLVFIGAPRADGSCQDTGLVHVARIADVDVLVQESSITPVNNGCGGAFGTARLGASLYATDGHLAIGHPGGWPVSTSGGNTTTHPNAGEALVYVSIDISVQTFFDLRNALAGTNGIAELIGISTLQPNAPLRMILTNAAPGALGFVFIGLTRIDAPFKGGVLVPAPDVVKMFPLGAGGFDLTTNWPSNLGSGFEFFYQVWWQDAGGPAGVAASNALRSLVP